MVAFATVTLHGFGNAAVAAAGAIACVSNDSMHIVSTTTSAKDHCGAVGYPGGLFVFGLSVVHAKIIEIKSEYQLHMVSIRTFFFFLQSVFTVLPPCAMRADTEAWLSSVETRRGLCGHFSACGTGCTTERGETKVATEKTED